jgi:4'-phosphopantetheinyl transferase
VSNEEARVWLVPAVAEEADRLAVLLSPEERAKADRYLRPADRVRSIVARGRLRQLLAGAAGVAPADLIFAYGPQGKPLLAAPPHATALGFNVSHSGDYVLIALCPNGALGVDLEQIRPGRDWKQIAGRFFSPDEQAWLESQPAEAFFRLWVIKEAWLKAAGGGLSIPLRDATVVFGPDGQPAIQDRPEWSVSELAVPEGYAAALVVDRRPGPR